MEKNGLKSQLKSIDIFACNVCETIVPGRKYSGRTMLKIIRDTFREKFSLKGGVNQAVEDLGAELKLENPSIEIRGFRCSRGI